jgi:hypothetical protein
MSLLGEGADAGEPFRTGERQRWLMGKGIGLVMAAALTMVAALATALVTAPGPGIAAASTAASHGEANRTASLPRPADVVRGRFVAPVSLDGGDLEVVPAPAGDRPRVSRKQAAQEIWASPVLQGHQAGPLGYGLVTIALRVVGVPHITKLPAWVGFAKSSGFAGCPEEPASSTSTSNPVGPSGEDLLSSGYAAVVIGAAHGSPAVTYTAPSLFCGSVQPAALALATEVLSVPWQALTGVENDSIQLRASLPACGSFESITSSGGAKVTTITVSAVVPDVHGRCEGARTTTQSVALGPIGNPPGAPPPLVTASTVIRHGSLGPMRLAVAAPGA